MMLGINIVSSPLAMTVRWRVVRHPIRKKRRGWSVKKFQEPCAYMIGDHTMYAHPSLVEMLKGAAL